MSRIKITSHSFLVQNFHEFFNLLLRQKELALRANDGNDPLKLSKQKGKKKDPDPILKPETLEETEAAITAAAEAANAATLEAAHEEDLKEIIEPEEP